VKETAFSGVFPTVAALTSRGAEVVVHDPLYTDDELRGLGFEPYQIGEGADLVILQTDHADYKTLAPAQIPGVKLLVDGRNASDPGLWAGTPRIVVGTAA
jgi:UDP-N-acetyl-D-mannosaminuronate dehydrogenase